MIRLIYENEEPTKTCLAPNSQLRRSVILYISYKFVNGILISLTSAETTSQEVFFHGYSTIFHFLNCYS